MSVTIQEALKSLNENIKDKRIQNLFNECVQELKRIGYSIDKNDIYLEESSTVRSLGDCTPVPDEYGLYRIRLSKHIYSSPDEEIRDTLLHELAHYIVSKTAVEKGIFYRDGFSGKWRVDPQNRSAWILHGEEWKKIINNINSKLGTNLSRISKNTDFKDEVDKQIKYEAECTNCHNKFSSFKKTGFMKALIDGDASRFQCPYCRKCGMFKLLKGD